MKHSKSFSSSVLALLFIDLPFLSFFVWIFFLILDPFYVFIETHVSGGDMVSHPWIVESLKKMYTQGHFWEWNHGWFAGSPFLYFYFLPAYLLAVLYQLCGLSPAVAFKAMVFSVVFVLPIAYYASARRWLSPPLSLFVLQLRYCRIF